MPLHTSFLEDWDIDLRRKRATHKTGLTVYFNGDGPHYWIASSSNARSWVKEDFENRAPLVSSMLRAAVTVYKTAYKNKGKGTRR